MLQKLDRSFCVRAERMPRSAEGCYAGALVPSSVAFGLVPLETHSTPDPPERALVAYRDEFGLLRFGEWGRREAEHVQLRAYPCPLAMQRGGQVCPLSPGFRRTVLMNEGGAQIRAGG